MTIEDMLRAQRNHAMDAAAQLAVTVEQLKAELAALEPAPARQATGYFDMSKAEFAAMEARQAKAQQAPVEMVPRQAAKVADPGQD